MFRSASVRWILGAVALLALLGILRFNPWQYVGAGGGATAGRQQLTVGFLPVT